MLISADFGAGLEKNIRESRAGELAALTLRPHDR
jgi:hypothetical protein